MRSLMQMYFIIKLKNEGWSDRKISQKYHISRNTVRKYWNKYLEKERLLLSQSHNSDLKEVVEQLLEDPKYDTSNRGYLKYNQEIDSALRKILDDEKKKTSLTAPHHKQKLTEIIDIYIQSLSLFFVINVKFCLLSFVYASFIRFNIS